ncbi:hypothetical protein [Frondihabitans sp. PAMC 28766]|uniref:hypothetical protein n=1 Tax=Frondihabitans sp. PAMC 28766 TaxID=1795630 RepID=UPI0012FFC93C|nr:hypothetical protein [Frondihabitans sp. PAMC 28766]
MTRVSDVTPTSTTSSSMTRAGRVIRAAVISIAIGWFVAIAALFVPFDAAPPWGVIVFVGSSIIFGLSVVVSVCLAVVAGAMCALASRNQQPPAFSARRLNPVSTIALTIVLFAPASFIIEKTLTIVALSS